MQRIPSRVLIPAAIVGVVGVIAVVALAARIGSMAQTCGAYSATVDAPAVANGVSVALASGTETLRFDSAALAEADLAAEANAQVLAAVNAMPVNLHQVGSVITFKRCGDQPVPIQLEAPAPDASLDAYAWDGTQWTWLGGSMGKVTAALPDVPQIVAWVESLPTAPIIGTEPDPQTGGLAPEYNGIITEVYAPGLAILSNGTLSGQVPTVPALGAPYVVYPVIRNVKPDGQVDLESVQALLGNEAARKSHVNALVSLTTGSNFAGIAIDYRGLAVQWKEPYAKLIEDLAAALHAQGKMLVVVLPMPLAASGTYQTDGYDWGRIGRAADVVVLDLPNASGMYQPDGYIQSYVQWAVTQVSRSKLQAAVTAASTYTPNEATLEPIAFAEVVKRLGPLGKPHVLSATIGATLTFSLSAIASQVVFDAQGGTYHGIAPDASLDTAATLAYKINALSGFGLRGVVIRDIQGPDVAPNLIEPIKAYRRMATITGSSELNVEWSIAAGDGSIVLTATRPLANADLVWTPNRDGVFNVSAMIAPVKLDVAQVTVGTGEPVSAGGGNGPVSTGETENCLNAAYIADVSVPDNTRFDKGKDFTKTWKVRNSGTCAWSADTELAFASGSQMGAASPVRVGALDVGKTIDISVPMKSGDKDGTFTGYWQLRNTDGAFGDQLSVVIKVGAEVAAPPTVVPPPSGGGPLSVGIQGHFYGYIDIDSGAQGIAGQVSDLGLGWVKVQFRWGDYDYYCGGPDLNALNSIISRANEAGLKVLLTIVGSPPCTHPWTSDVHVPPDDPNALAEIAGGLADLFKYRIHAIEVWDRENTSMEWNTSPQTIDATRYTQLLAAAHAAIKAKDPNIMVISGALEPRSWNDGVNSVDDFVYLKQLVDAGAMQYVDCVGARSNTLRVPPSASQGGEYDSLFQFPNHSYYFKDTILNYMSISKKPVCVTEFGVASPEGVGKVAGFEWADDNTQQEQADWTSEALSLCKQWGCKMMVLFNLDYGKVTRQVDANAIYSYTYIDLGYSRRPVFSAVKNWCATNGCK